MSGHGHGRHRRCAGRHARRSAGPAARRRSRMQAGGVPPWIGRRARGCRQRRGLDDRRRSGRSHRRRHSRSHGAASGRGQEERVKHTSSSEADTRALAAALAPSLMPGAVILLSGDLGAGKTAFVRGLAEGLDLDADEVTSPTFTLVHEYRGGRLPLIHVDLYRLDRAELDEIGLDQDLAAHGVTAVEWAERLTRGIADAIAVRITDDGGDHRTITIER